jgi:hypothetical protein
VNENFAVAAIETIINSTQAKEIPIDRIREEFLANVEHTMDHYLIADETVENFIQRNSKNFEISNNGYVRVKNPENFFNICNMIPWDFNQKDYITSTKTTRNCTVSNVEVVSLIDDENQIIHCNNNSRNDYNPSSLNTKNNLNNNSDEVNLNEIIFIEDE